MMTFRELIKKSEQRAKEKEAIWFLITEITSNSRAELLLKLDKIVPHDLLILLEEAITKYCEDNIPVQYIVGHTYFYGLKIKVNPHVLIPRFETEELVERVIAWTEKNLPLDIIDVGCGSGCIAIALHKKWPNAHIDAVDISNEALLVAKQNAHYHQANIHFFENDLLKGIKKQYDIIVSNPPYIDPAEEVDDLVRNNEPHIALFSSNKGLDHYIRLIEQAKSCLKPNGFLALEIASNKRNSIEEIAKKHFSTVTCFRDLQQKERILIMR